jgi:hypothetical protein
MRGYVLFEPGAPRAVFGKTEGVAQRACEPALRLHPQGSRVDAARF